MAYGYNAFESENEGIIILCHLDAFQKGCFGEIHTRFCPESSKTSFVKCGFLKKLNPSLE